jgi:tetratricopeptide (TPR) repeat protein
MLRAFLAPIQIRFGSSMSTAAQHRRVRVDAPAARDWPFLYPFPVEFPSEPSLLVVPDLHEAFVNEQGSNTRLVTTQPTYLFTALLDLIRDKDVAIEATADAETLTRLAPEILQRKGAFAQVEINTAPPAPSAPDAPGAPSAPSAPSVLSLAFRTPDVRTRLALCVEALDEERTPGALVATASVCMEVNDLEAAGRDLDEAIEKAPDYAAAHFERGKVWLRVDDMERASASFQAAATRLTAFGPAWANLGATLGELDRPHEALQAFTKALACDPSSAQAHNNIGVVSRELGKLSESEAAFRRTIELSADLAFGYYNLGHTLFLQGRYQAALNAYAEGQKRDPERNPVQASRLAMCRLATGDAAGAVAELQRATNALPHDYRLQLLADTQSIAWALLTHRPDLPGWHQVHDWLTREQAR